MAPYKRLNFILLQALAMLKAGNGEREGERERNVVEHREKERKGKEEIN